MISIRTDIDVAILAQDFNAPAPVFGMQHFHIALFQNTGQSEDIAHIIVHHQTLCGQPAWCRSAALPPGCACCVRTDPLRPVQQKHRFISNRSMRRRIADRTCPRQAVQIRRLLRGSSARTQHNDAAEQTAADAPVPAHETRFPQLSEHHPIEYNAIQILARDDLHGFGSRGACTHSRSRSRRKARHLMPQRVRCCNHQKLLGALPWNARSVRTPPPAVRCPAPFGRTSWRPAQNPRRLFSCPEMTCTGIWRVSGSCFR